MDILGNILLPFPFNYFLSNVSRDLIIMIEFHLKIAPLFQPSAGARPSGLLLFALWNLAVSILPPWGNAHCSHTAQFPHRPFCFTMEFSKLPALTLYNFLSDISRYLVIMIEFHRKSPAAFSH